MFVLEHSPTLLGGMAVTCLWFGECYCYSSPVIMHEYCETGSSTLWNGIMAKRLHTNGQLVCK
jgi:hypothetical protein